MPIRGEYLFVVLPNDQGMLLKSRAVASQGGAPDSARRPGPDGFTGCTTPPAASSLAPDVQVQIRAFPIILMLIRQHHRQILGEGAFRVADGREGTGGGYQPGFVR